MKISEELETRSKYLQKNREKNRKKLPASNEVEGKKTL